MSAQKVRSPTSDLYPFALAEACNLAVNYQLTQRRGLEGAIKRGNIAFPARNATIRDTP